MNRQSGARCLGVALLAACALPGGLALRAAPPNILVILTDDQGWADYSAAGTPDIRTPHIDRIFREGARMDNFYANSPVCSPTRAALFTGRHPDRAGVPGVIRTSPAISWGWLAAHAPLLPEALRPAGYHSALVGKWHLGLQAPNLPNARGFDRFHGFLGDMMSDYWTHERNGKNFLRLNGEPITATGHATDVFTEWACAELEERAGSGRPFFLCLAYNAPHYPVQPPPEWLERVRRREPGLPAMRAALVALVEHLDAGIGRVLDTLDRTGLTADTLVIFTSDNGGSLPHGANNGPWRSGKQHLYEGGLRVPFAARWPGRIAPGGRLAAPAVTMDIFATACAAAGIAPPAGIDGVDLLPLLTGRVTGLAERDLYFVYREGTPVPSSLGGLTAEALRRGDWKPVHDGPSVAHELYNLRTDPCEQHDLAAAEPEKLKELILALARQIQRGGAVPWQPPDGVGP